MLPFKTISQKHFRIIGKNQVANCIFNTLKTLDFKINNSGVGSRAYSLQLRVKVAANQSGCCIQWLCKVKGLMCNFCNCQRKNHRINSFLRPIHRPIGANKKGIFLQFSSFITKDLVKDKRTKSQIIRVIKYIKRKFIMILAKSCNAHGNVKNNTQNSFISYFDIFLHFHLDSISRVTFLNYTLFVSLREGKMYGRGCCP